LAPIAINSEERSTILSKKRCRLSTHTEYPCILKIKSWFYRQQGFNWVDAIENYDFNGKNRTYLNKNVLKWQHKAMKLQTSRNHNENLLTLIALAQLHKILAIVFLEQSIFRI